tara:strand:- start:3891 stop:4298 length:408 start_codon:yes stop_codon:yes gene_type:complete
MGFINYIKNIFRLRKILCLDLSKSMKPSREFTKENIKQSLLKCNSNDYIAVLETIERLESDIYLEVVGFRFKNNSKYSEDIEIDGESFEQWEMTDNLNEDELQMNRILIEKAEILRNEDKENLNKLIKKIIDEIF